MSTRTFRPVVGLVACAALAFPAGAGAATVSLAPQGKDFDGTPSKRAPVRYVAAAGEDNNLVVRFEFVGNTRDAIATFSDSGAQVHAGPGCAQVDAHTARCDETPSRMIDTAQVLLGAGNDKVRKADPNSYPRFPIHAFGGTGNDVLDTGGGDDKLVGGGGTDQLRGGLWRDTLSDGDRDGAAGAAAPNADVMDGGGDVDTLSYAQRTRRVTVNLESGRPTGRAGEGDESSGFENVTGGSGNDRLVGDGGGNELRGRRGNDDLLGRAGDDRRLYWADRLSGGPGRDRLEGGDGNDWLIPGRGRDWLSCALGDDRVVKPEAGEVIGRCEELHYQVAHEEADMVFAPRPTDVFERRLDYRMSCPNGNDGVDVWCKGKLTLREATGKRRLLGRGRIAFDASVYSHGTPQKPVRVRLTRLGRRLVARRSGVLATASLRGRYLPKAFWTTRIRR